MRDEISAAVVFLARLIEKGENFNPEKLENFKTHLSELLVERFENHWFPELPHKGQGYRCIRVNERDRHDASLAKAAHACGIKYEDMKLPVELTIWVDPNEVCCRFGENKGSHFTLASFNDKENLNQEKDNTNGQLEDVLTKTHVEPFEEKKQEPAKKTSSTSFTNIKESKLQSVPLTTNNSRQGSRKNQSSPKQKSGGRRTTNNPNGNGFPHPMQSWYSIISPHWMSPSPPPYHPMLRSPSKWGGAPMPPHPRYHWSNKPTLKV
uniref:Anti-proliferative protein domain-containing protein n=1 Tax=Clastoptera arizonana TaxID=38151 RepID=A0A1B6C3B4_9HEMI